MERPTIPPWSIERKLLVICNHLFTMVFTMEMAMKAVAFSLVIGENCYFSDNWNRMDGTLVIVGLIDTLGRKIFIIHSPKIVTFLSIPICWKSEQNIWNAKTFEIVQSSQTFKSNSQSSRSKACCTVSPNIT